MANWGDFEPDDEVDFGGDSDPDADLTDWDDDAHEPPKEGNDNDAALAAPADAGMPAARAPPGEAVAPPPRDVRAAATPGGSRRRAASVGASATRWPSPFSEDGDRSRSTDRGGSPVPRIPLFARPAQLLTGQRTLPLRRCGRLAAAAPGGA